MSEISIITNNNWTDFLQSEISVLILERDSCTNCKEWSKEIHSSNFPKMIKFGKLNLDKPGLGRIKIAHPWIAEVDFLPYNAIFVNGEMKKHWAGGGINRLQNRLDQFM